MNKISAFSFKNWSSECIYRFVQPDRRRLNLLWKCIAIIYWTDEFDNGFVQMIKYIHFEICNPIFFFTFYARTYCAFVGFNYCSSHKSCEFSFFVCLCVFVRLELAFFKKKKNYWPSIWNPLNEFGIQLFSSVCLGRKWRP